MRKLSTIIHRSHVHKVRKELENWANTATDPKLIKTARDILKKVKQDAELSEEELNILGTYLNSLPE